MSDECSICLDEIAVATTGCVQLSCSHKYHLGCISTWYQKNASCPECRSKPSEKEAPPPPPRPSFSHHGNLTDTVIAWERDEYSLMTNHSEHFMITLPRMTRGHTTNNTLTEVQINQLRQVLSSTGSQTANAPAATSEESRDNDVQLVSTQAGVPLDVARTVLEECQGDIVAAIMEITMGPSSANLPDTFELPELNPLVAAGILD